MEMAQCPMFYLGEASENRDSPLKVIYGNVSDGKPHLATAPGLTVIISKAVTNTG